MCESVSCCSACDLDGFGILVFGPQTRNLHPGGSGRRGGLEIGGWQCGGPTGGREVGREVGWVGVKLGCPSLLPLSLVSCSLPPSLPPFACVQLLQLSVSPLTLSGSYRQEFKGPLLYASSAGTTTASSSSRTHWSEGRPRDRRLIRKRFNCELFFLLFDIRV